MTTVRWPSGITMVLVLILAMSWPSSIVIHPHIHE
jgi:hypothetical protein